MGDDTNRSSKATHYELTGTRMSPHRTTVDTGDGEFVVGKDGNPVEYFLGAVVACLNSTGSMVARDMDITLDELELTVAGDVDYSRYKGEESEARAGLQGVEVSLSVTADADDATLQTWLDRVKERCPVTDNVENETSLSVTLRND